MENWLEIVISIFIIGMILYGHYRGFFRLAVSASAIILTIIAVNIAMPYVTQFLRGNTPIVETISNVIKSAIMEEMNVTDNEAPSQQRSIIEQLELPEQLKFSLLENNNNEVYQMLGVERFSDYICHYISNIIINAAGVLLIYLICFILIRIVAKWLDIISRLPILSGLNKIAGAILGGVQAVLLVWVFFVIITIMSGTPFARMMLNQISNSLYLHYLYNHNIFITITTSLIKSIM